MLLLLLLSLGSHQWWSFTVLHQQPQNRAERTTKPAATPPTAHQVAFGGVAGGCFGRESASSANHDSGGKVSTTERSSTVASAMSAQEPKSSDAVLWRGNSGIQPGLRKKKIQWYRLFQEEGIEGMKVKWRRLCLFHSVHSLNASVLVIFSIFQTHRSRGQKGSSIPRTSWIPS